MLNDIDRARDALHAIPPDLPRDEWVRAGMAAQAAGLDFDAFNDWSAQAGNYDERAARDTWRSFKPGKGVGAGTLYRVAAEHGWRMDGSKPQQRPVQVPMQAAALPRNPAPGMSPAEVWARGDAATAAHGYIVAKAAAGVPLDALRVVPAGDPLRIQGESMAGALMVPAFAPDGSLQSLQCVTTGDTAARLKAKGKKPKLNLPGAPMAGASFTVGDVVPGAPVHIVEGIGQAWACWQATGHPAVACFGAGNMARVAADQRQRDASARLVLVPDVGKESEAAKIAQTVGAAVAAMPDRWEKNSDVNDLAQRDGLDALAALLESAQQPPAPTPDVHPLARYVDIDGTAKPPRWVIPGFIGHGVVVIAGAHGVGKTTALLPLALTAAGLQRGDLMPRQWRHVVYVTEDVEQARRILAGIVGHGGMGLALEAVRERVHIVEAVRLDPVFVASVGTTYREQFTRAVEGVEVLPLVVLDTKSAVLAQESENDNAEASAMMAALKQGFDGLPVWLIGHVAKANLSRNDALTARGASAIEGDANQTLFLIREGESRFLVQGKTRFEPRWPELEITSYTAQTVEPDEFGNMETVTLRWGIAAPPQQTRKEAAEQAAERQRQEDEAALRQEVRDAIEAAWLLGNPLGRAGVRAKVRRKAQDVVATLENLLSERWLYEVQVPAAIRAVNSKAAFLVNLSTVEHEAVLAGAGLPAEKLVVPQSWRKPEIPPVPAPEEQSEGDSHDEP